MEEPERWNRSPGPQGGPRADFSSCVCFAFSGHHCSALWPPKKWEHLERKHSPPPKRTTACLPEMENSLKQDLPAPKDFQVVRSICIFTWIRSGLTKTETWALAWGYDSHSQSILSSFALELLQTLVAVAHLMIPWEFLHRISMAQILLRSCFYNKATVDQSSQITAR